MEKLLLFNSPLVQRKYVFPQNTIGLAIYCGFHLSI